MRPLLIALIVLIRAVVPASPMVQDVADLLRQAAVKAGCDSPRVAMWWMGGPKGVEIEVTCAVPDPTQGEPHGR